MQYPEEVRYDAVARMDAGQTVDDVAAALSVGKGTLIRWRAEYNNAKKEGTLETLFDVTKLLLATAELQSRSPAGMVEVVAKESTALQTQLKGLDKLDHEMQQTASIMNTRIQSLMLSVEHVSELEMLVDSLCSLRAAFFAKGTQVNVQQNFGGASKYGDMLGDRPGA